MIDTKYIEINGIKQFMYERIWDCNNPIVLYIHGGPGSAFSDYGYLLSYLDRYFNVIHYDQRGSGKTLIKNPDKAATYSLLLEDLDVTIDYIRKEYHKEKIILLGHSFGSALAFSYLQKHPQKVQYYIGVGQVTNPIKDERVGYEKVLELVKEAGNLEELRILEQMSDYPGTCMDALTYERLCKVRYIQMKYGIASQSIGHLKEASPIYTIEDNIDSSLIEEANRKVYEEFLTLDFMKENYPFSVPFYLILGEFDFQVPYVQGAAFIKNINAVHKKLYLLANAAHRPMIEQPEQFLEAMLEIRQQNMTMKGEN